ncbi:MAG: hypothetical protein HY719_11525 [Planctomycetes bacterium]|nr:hypothetical protein [Planctomycetota bacterium]
MAHRRAPSPIVAEPTKGGRDSRRIAGDPFGLRMLMFGQSVRDGDGLLLVRSGRGATFVGIVMLVALAATTAYRWASGGTPLGAVDAYLLLVAGVLALFGRFIVVLRVDCRNRVVSAPTRFKASFDDVESVEACRPQRELRFSIRGGSRPASRHAIELDHDVLDIVVARLRQALPVGVREGGTTNAE